MNYIKTKQNYLSNDSRINNIQHPFSANIGLYDNIECCCFLY